MHESVRSFVARQTRNLGAQRVLEVGAVDINGGVRDLFPDADYFGIDLAEGPGVDRVLSAHHLDQHLERGCYDLVLCLEMLEHDEAPWLTVPQLATMVRPGGHVIISARGNGFPEHNRPDRWRFMRDGMRSLVESAGLTIHRLDTDPQVPGWLVLAQRPEAA
ncbi:MAG: hypothetical protein IT196_05360 [Acidimicrobiales bacterium]|nr:hypothetical protein [Acidimicrobiales bacterium]